MNDSTTIDDINEFIPASILLYYVEISNLDLQNYAKNHKRKHTL